MNTPSRALDAIQRAEALVPCGVPLPSASYVRAIGLLDVAAAMLAEAEAKPAEFTDEDRAAAHRVFLERRSAALEERMLRGRQVGRALGLPVLS